MKKNIGKLPHLQHKSDEANSQPVDGGETDEHEYAAVAEKRGIRIFAYQETKRRPASFVAGLLL